MGFSYGKTPWRSASRATAERRPTGPLFTLVELLVVIAIIIVLVSLLLPALATARESAKSISCRGNLKQVSLCFAMYLNDNNNYYPSIWGWFGDDVADWSFMARGMAQYCAGGAVFYQCPSKLRQSRTGTDGKALLGYGLSQSVGGIYQWPPAQQNSRVETVTKPGGTVGFVDSSDQLGGEGSWAVMGAYLGWATPYCNRRYGELRHNRRPSVLWLDQHVNNATPSSLDIYGTNNPWKLNQ